MIRCYIDALIDEKSKCAWCCIYCKDECEYRCGLCENMKTEEEVMESDCPDAYDI